MVQTPSRLFRNKFFLLLPIFLCSLLIISPTHASTRITKSQIESAAVFKSLYSGSPLGAATQGGVVTEDYYVFSDCKGRSGASCRNGYIRIVNRNSCAKVKYIKTDVKSVRGLYYNRGKKQITVVNKDGNRAGCLSLGSNPSFKTSGSCTMPPSLTYSRGGYSQGVAAEYNGYKYKISGLGTSETYILVSGKGVYKEYYIKNKDIKAVSKLKAKYGFEPEGISVDNKTGEVYISYALRVPGKNNRRIFFLKIKSSVFKSYTGKSGQSSTPVCNNTKASTNSNSGSSSSGGSSSKVEPSNKESYNPSQSTYDGSVATNFFGNLQDDNKGCGVFMVLNFIIDMLTFGIAIAAAIGIGIAGITYLTAKGNVAQATKAKRRIYEIIIGLAAYAVLYVGLNFLLPGGNWSVNKTCEAASSSSRAVTGNQN